MLNQRVPLTPGPSPPATLVPDTSLFLKAGGEGSKTLFFSFAFHDFPY